jgi:2-polyprenyl-3-methyl-5-hydroxy-6-metoxy-1,4-benzoquinol methylase
MRILVAIASYGTRNDRYLAEVIRRYQAMPYDVDIVVLSNIDKPVPHGVTVQVGLPAKNPWTLPFGHKKLFADRANNYDLFIYSEDDTPLSEQNLEAFLRVTEILPENQIAGFLRSETGPDGKKYFCDVFGPFHWDLKSVQRSGAYTFAHFTNEHSACYVLTQKQLRKAIDSGGFLVAPHEEKYDLLVSAATDPYTQCGLTRMLCISHLQDFTVPHLPNKYVGVYGVGCDEFREEIQALVALNGQARETLRLFPSVSKLKAMGFSKNLYEAERKELAELIPVTAKTVLSIGSAHGRTETWLRERGLTVTAVPLDPVISASSARKGVELIHGDFGTARQSLAGRKFDCLLFLDVLHLIPEPAHILKVFSELLTNDGVVITVIPNVSRLRAARRKYTGEASLWDLNDYQQTGVHLTSRKTLRDWYKKAGLQVEKTLTALTKRGQEINRLTLGMSDVVFATEFTVVGRKGAGHRSA